MKENYQIYLPYQFHWRAQSALGDSQLPHKKMKTTFLWNMSKSRRLTSTFFPITWYPAHQNRITSTSLASRHWHQTFLALETQLYKRLCPSVGRSVCPSVEVIELKTRKTRIFDASVGIMWVCECVGGIWRWGWVEVCQLLLLSCRNTLRIFFNCVRNLSKDNVLFKRLSCEISKVF